MLFAFTRASVHSMIWYLLQYLDALYVVQYLPELSTVSLSFCDFVFDLRKAQHLIYSEASQEVIMNRHVSGGIWKLDFECDSFQQQEEIVFY